MSFIEAALIGAGGDIGGSLISSLSNGGKPGIEDNYVPGPNSGIEQSTANNWANWLNSANAGNDYNAISPDWNDIWGQTQQQVQNYFSGTATNPGVNDQINASFAQRGMSGDPAASFLQAQSGANESQDLGNLSAQENIAKQQFAQQGEENWLNSMSQFQGAINPTAGSWTGAQPYATTGQQIGNAIGAAGSGAAQYGINAANNQSQDEFLQSYINGNAGYSFAPESGATGTTYGAAI